MTKGALYIVYENKKNKRHSSDLWFKECVHSVKTLKKIHPNLPITLFSDRDPKIPQIDDVRIFNLPEDMQRLKPFVLKESPYDYTMYIDTDTAIINPIEDTFDLLDRFDLAAVPDCVRRKHQPVEIWPEYAKIPDSFGEVCGGLIFYKKSDAFLKFMDIWENNYTHWYKISGSPAEQPSLRVSLWQSNDLKMHLLPIEYCIRTQEKIDGIHKKFPKIPKIHHWHSMFDKGVKRVPHKIHL